MATRTALLHPKSVKLQWVMSAQRVPRDLLGPDVDSVEWQLQLDGTDVAVRVVFSAHDYERLLRDLDARGEAMVTLDGFLVGAPGSFVLEKVRFKVDRRRGGPKA